jgi:hypothetical protein
VPRGWMSACTSTRPISECKSATTVDSCHHRHCPSEGHVGNKQAGHDICGKQSSCRQP